MMLFLLTKISAKKLIKRYGSSRYFAKDEKENALPHVKLIKEKGKYTMIKSTKTDWHRLSRRNEEDIDYSDIPKTDEGFWDGADVVSPHKKVDFTINIDEDLALWLHERGKSSNQAVNSMIRAYFLINA